MEHLLHIHNYYSILVVTVTDFVSKFAHVYESFAQELQSLVDVYKQKTSDYGKDIEG